MSENTLFSSMLEELRSSLVLPPDQPEETAESTLRALWHAASGHPCSARRAMSVDLAELNETQQARLHDLASRRISGLPLMQLTGRASFMGLELEFDRDVFVIRPETELLGQTAVDELSAIPHPVMIDVGCGSGNLTCGIASSVSALTVFAVDILESCAGLTRRNVDRCNLSTRVSVAVGDLFAPLENLDLVNKVDAVICNPPYIASGRLKGDRSYLTAHEPLEAFDGGPFGLRMQQRLIAESPRFLKSGGVLLFEFGAGQDKQVQKLFERAGTYASVRFKSDRDGIARVVVARKA